MHRAEAVTYYSQTETQERLIECYYMLEDFDALEKVMRTLPEKSPLLLNIGDKFMVMGIFQPAVAAFLKAGDVKAAVDCCVTLNQVLTSLSSIHCLS